MDGAGTVAAGWRVDAGQRRRRTGCDRRKRCRRFIRRGEGKRPEGTGLDPRIIAQARTGATD